MFEQNNNTLKGLLKLSIAKRREMIANDLKKKKPEFSNIPPHDLADALGVPDSRRPINGEWYFEWYTERISLEDYVNYNDPISVLIYEIEEMVSESRFSELILETGKLDDTSKICLDFLTKRERKLLESVIATWQLEGHMNCVAHYKIEVASGQSLNFEAFIEDDGSCCSLLTPYDYDAGKFVNFDDCITEDDASADFIENEKLKQKKKKRVSDGFFTDPLLEEEEHRAEPPRDASLVCSYEISTSMFTEDEESVFFRRTNERDELWISDFGFGSQKEGCVYAVPKQYDENTACLKLLEKLFAHSFSGTPTKFLKSGIVTKDEFESILGKIKSAFEKNIKDAHKNETEIVKAAKELKLYTRPDGSNPGYWLATCPGTNHSLLLNASLDEFWCGYCNRKGGIDELREFVKERMEK